MGRENIALSKIKELISNKNPLDNKQAKKLAMRKNIKLGILKREFCRNCYYPLNGKIRIKNGYKIITCGNCCKKYRFKIS